ncbi:hypothetical protein PQB78_gp87 [Arthrobacter phage Xenomorph]|uniref:Ryanodine receptor Ryr domain-containing protein n=1 Tax=Arthrobacter phage Xenomorph TaxID=2591069 RepID=A0A514A401_9CAUD|nr:hypothetical protein PQB78_gp87 [Arthrobacter phage Xenomorph]QDH48000.1 hypothetical protein SEA_XENOMORPH_87 [Arthrobacter phage Xenomorph]
MYEANFRDFLMPIDLIARVCHEANRSVQIYSNDESMSPTWDLAPDWQKHSAKQGVVEALEGKTSEQLHQAWCDHKVDEGWRYGEKKDSEAKTHPCLIPYDELPEEQKLKDSVFGSIVMAFEDFAKAQMTAAKIWDDSEPVDG